MNRPFFSSVLPIFTICFLLLSFAVHAQGLPSGITGITLTVSANNPTPGQTVTVTAASYSFNINPATIIWTVNGKQAQKGIGATTLDVTAPPLGNKTTVDVTAVTPSGGRYSDTLTIGSGLVDMIMETDGYVSPFFLGKTPLVYQNDVTVIAMPHLANASGQEYDPATLVYQWKKDDGTVLQSQSGYGKQSITLPGGIVPRPYYLFVTATSRDGSAQGESLIDIVPQSPSITFYSDDPLYGPLWNRAVGNTLVIGSQKETRAFAALFGFNFSPGNTSGLALDWTINGAAHPELSSSQSVVLRAPDGVSGSSKVALDVQGLSNILQGADAAFTAVFSANGPSASTTPVVF